MLCRLSTTVSVISLVNILVPFGRCEYFSSIYLLICLFICLFVYLFTCLFVCLFVCLLVYVYMFVYSFSAHREE